MTLHLRDLDTSCSGGILYVTIGETAFPEEGWYDLVSTDLENWMPGLMSFARGHTDYCTLGFMDGPAVVRLTRQTNGAVSAVCLWNQDKCISEAEIDFIWFLKSVAKCIRSYNRALHVIGKIPRFGAELTTIKTIIGETYV